jgi:VCBS repeat-containing protein
MVAEDGTVTSAQPAIANASLDLAERSGFADAGVYTPGIRNAAFSDIFISLSTPFMVGDLQITKFYVQSVGTVFADDNGLPSYRVQGSDATFFVYVESSGPQGVDSFCVTNAQWVGFRLYQGAPYGEFTFSNTLQMELYGRQLTLKLSLSSPAAPFSAAFKAHQPFVSLVDQTAPTSPVTLSADIALDLDGSTDLKRFLWFESFDRPGESFLGEGNPISAPLRKGERLVSVVAYDAKGSYSTATMKVTVPNVPPVANDDAYETDEDQTLMVPIPGVRTNDYDANGDGCSLILESDPAHGNLMLEDGGSFIYVPDHDYSGVDSFTYKLNDFTAYSNVATVTITIRSVNDAPVAVNDSYSAKEDKKLVLGAPGVLANDTDAEGSALTAALLTNPSHGTVTLASNGSFTYWPGLDYFGPDAFSYRASDGTAWSSAATVSITVVERKPDEEMGDIKEIITALVPGTLNAGQASALLVKIDVAIAKYQAGQNTVACNLLTALISQVDSFVADGTLPAATGQEIRVRAENILGEMGCI